MPLPWLIGAAVVAAAAAVVKAVSDDDSSSSSISGEEERRKQEREAKRQRKREGLETRLVNLKRNRLESARNLLARSMEVLEKSPVSAVGLTASKFDAALKAKKPATSEYAQALSSALGIEEASQSGCSRRELSHFLANLQALDSLYSGASLGTLCFLTGAAIGHAGPARAVFESMHAPTKQTSVIVLSDAEREALDNITQASTRLKRLQRLKSQIEQQG